MKISIHQPMYIPWIPYFFKLFHSDLFVFFDDVQYPRSKNYNNRNYIKGPKGLILLTVPIKQRSNLILINEIEINNEINWQKKHWKSIYLNYKKSKYFSKYKDKFENIYLNQKWNKISDLNISLIILISKLSNMNTKFVKSSDIKNKNSNGGEKILQIIKFLESDTYITGKGEGSLKYFDKEYFIKRNINIKFCSYNALIYDQMFNNFLKDCSILDLFFNYGENTGKFISDNSSLDDF